MSDTHTLTAQIKFDIPDGDVFIHAGDFTLCGAPQEVENFNKWLGKNYYLIVLILLGAFRSVAS